MDTETQTQNIDGILVVDYGFGEFDPEELVEIVAEAKTVPGATQIRISPARVCYQIRSRDGAVLKNQLTKSGLELQARQKMLMSALEGR